MYLINIFPIISIMWFIEKKNLAWDVVQEAGHILLTPFSPEAAESVCHDLRGSEVCRPGDL